jgi:hypothetical protein
MNIRDMAFEVVTGEFKRRSSEISGSVMAWLYI